jgi:hypothetical protein
MLLIFIAGVYYLVDQRKREIRQKIIAEQIKQEQIKTVSAPVMPLKPEKMYVIKLSMQTLNTLRSLTEDPNHSVRAASAELLWELQDEKSPAIIKRMFQEDTEESVKQSLITILLKSKSRLSLALLSEAMDSFDKETRMKAVDAIGSFSNDESIRVLNKGLEDYDEDIRLKSLQAVNKIRRDIELHKEKQLRALADSKPLFRIE